MSTLPRRPLTTLTLTVAFDQLVTVGDPPAGRRRIATVTGGRFEGERLSCTAPGGHDRVINRPDGVMVIDGLLTLKTDDGETVYLTYQVRFLAEAEAMARFRCGGRLWRRRTTPWPSPPASNVAPRPTAG